MSIKFDEGLHGVSVNDPKEFPVGSERAGLRINQPMKIAEQTWPEATAPVVSICCATYNHAAFIRDCIDGFLAQRTTFPIEILINDDASTDRTADIIRDYTVQYPHLIKPIFQTQNQLSKGLKPNPNFNFPRVKGEYIAFCEGDDYWTDPLKLEKQVQFLQTHTDHSLCWTRFKTRDEKTGEFVEDNNGHYFSGPEGREFNFEVFQKGWHIGMQTLLFRAIPLLQSNHFSNPQYKDVFLISDLLHMGKGYCLNEFTAIYRLHEGGVYSSTTATARAKIGAATYKEIFKTYQGNIYLKKKYEHFNGLLVDLLVKQQRYSEAMLALDEQLSLTTPSTEEKSKLLAVWVEQLITNRDAALTQRDEENHRLRAELQHIHNSLSFKSGRILTKPLRTVAKIKSGLTKGVQTRIGELINRAQSQTYKNRLELQRRGIEFIDRKQIIKDSRHLAPLPKSTKPNPELIVSLTSFPARFPDVYFTLYSLLNQSIKPDKIILWLADSQFPKREMDLPKRVRGLTDYGLTIRWCKDLRSYKKLIPALREFPDATIVTADDDIFYPSNWLELLLESYNSEPQHIHCHRAHRIAFDADGNVASYANWQKCIPSSQASYLNFFTTGGGVLFPANSLHSDVLNEALFMELCPTADDIWFWTMAVLRGTKIRVVEQNLANVTFLDPEVGYELKDGNSLWQLNKQTNDSQLEHVLGYYKSQNNIVIKDNDIMPIHSTRTLVAITP